MSDFTYLSIHTHFSRAGGPTSPLKWCIRARDLGYTSIGIADRSPLAGWPDLFNAARQTGLTPIYGIEIDFILPADASPKGKSAPDPILQGALLFARNAEGTTNMAALASIAYKGWPATETPIPWHDLAAHAGGLILVLLGADEAGAPQPIASADPKKAQTWATALKTAFPNSIYMGLPNSGRSGDSTIAQTIASRSGSLDLPLLALPTARYLQPSDAPAYEALKVARGRAEWPRTASDSASTTGSIASDREGYDYLQAPDAILDLYSKWPEAIENASTVAEQLVQPDTWPFTTPPAEQGRDTLLVTAPQRPGAEDSSSAFKETLAREIDALPHWGSAGAWSALSTLASYAADPQHPIPLGQAAASHLAFALGISNTPPIAPETQPDGLPPTAPVPGLTIPASGRSALLKRLSDEYGPDRVAYAACALNITPVQALTAAASVLSIEGDTLRGLILPALDAGWPSLDAAASKLAAVALALKDAPLTFAPDPDTAVAAPRSIYPSSTLASWSPLIHNKSATRNPQYAIPISPWPAESLSTLGYPLLHLPSTPALEGVHAALRLAVRYPVPGFVSPPSPFDSDALPATLKTQHPTAYFAGALGVAWQRGEASAVAPLADEARKLNVKLDPPHINFSLEHPTIQRDGTSWSVLWGLSMLPGWPSSSAARFIAARPANGFASLASLVEAALAADLTAQHIITLVMAGACDTLGDRPRDRYALISALPSFFEWAATQAKHRAATANQPDLFAIAPNAAPPLEVDLTGDNAQASFGAAPASDPPHIRYARRAWERENLGVAFTNADDLDTLVAMLDASGALSSRLISTDKIENKHLGSTIHLVGLLSNISLMSGPDGETLATGNLEDTHGSIELIAFPPNYKRHANLWLENNLVAVTARVEAHAEGGLFLLCEQLAPFAVGSTDESFSITIKTKVARPPKEAAQPAKPAQPLYPSRPDLKIIPPPPPDPAKAAPPPITTGPAAYNLIISIPDADEDQTVIDSMIDLKRLLEQHPGPDSVTIRVPYIRGKWTSANLSRGVRYSHHLENQIRRLLGNDAIAVIQLAS